jgi:hypothetical protein
MGVFDKRTTNFAKTILHIHRTPGDFPKFHKSKITTCPIKTQVKNSMNNKISMVF